MPGLHAGISVDQAENVACLLSQAQNWIDHL